METFTIFLHSNYPDYTGLTLGSVLCIGGWVVSKDGDIHYISSFQLSRLYRVNPRECIFAESPDDVYGLRLTDLVVLRPRSDGNYTIRKVEPRKNKLREEKRKTD